MQKRHLAATGAVLTLSLGLAACGSSSKKTVSSSSPTTVAPAADTSGGGSAYGVPGTSVTTAAGAAASGAAVVTVATSSKDGQILVGPNGHTLYLFEKDSGTTSACTGGCAAIWPALAASPTPAGGTGVDATKLSTANGQVANQVVYNGHLLYFFSGDQAAGDINGTKIPQWYPVSPAGDKIDKD